MANFPYVMPGDVVVLEFKDIDNEKDGYYSYHSIKDRLRGQTEYAIYYDDAIFSKLSEEE